jgi:cysteine desulfurase
MMPGVCINSPLDSVPHIINISIMSMPAKDTQEYLASEGIYVSTQTACSSDDSRSETVYRLTLSETKARSSIRISLSHLSTKAEVETLLNTIGRIGL